MSDRGGKRKTKVGRVVSAAMQKTIVVQVERRVRHPLYKKEIRRHKKFYAHDEEERAREGDLVRIVETRPLSRLKRWRLLEVLKSGRGEAERAVRAAAGELKD
ncbi:MAG TPA: 30S ribosomal protein S17 [Kiritimatiellae bacterium]|nr:30S ribosomal protein S17 [Kiritimatiellia bacterium]